MQSDSCTHFTARCGMVNTKMGRRIALTLEERVEVIKGYEIDHKSARKLASEFSVGRTQILETIKHKDDWIKAYDSETSVLRKRLHKGRCRKITASVAKLSVSKWCL